MAFALRDSASPTLQEGAALHRALHMAQRAADVGDLPRVWAQLRGHAARFVPFALAGPFWEMCARCAFAGVAGVPAHIDGQTALTRALHAYQEEHDVPGMARVHAALGGALMGKGELVEASRELGYAQQLSMRSGAVAQRIGSLCRRTEVALLRMDVEAARELANQALDACRQHQASDLLEAQARLMAAQASALSGHVHKTARHLLWAERLTAYVPPLRVDDAGLGGTAGASLGTAAAAIAMLRSETLYRLGFPRRALSCLQAAARAPAWAPSAPGEDGAPLEGRAHHLRLLGACLVADQPAQAMDLLVQAERAFAHLKQGYFRAFCQITLAQAGARAAAPQAQHLLEVASTLRLARWPLLNRQFEQIRAQPGGPSVRVRGAVQVPWVVEVGQSRRRAPAPQETPHDIEQGLLGRLQGVMGRKRPTDDN